jgi:acyl-CoA thioesterase I
MGRLKHTDISKRQQTPEHEEHTKVVKQNSKKGSLVKMLLVIIGSVILLELAALGWLASTVSTYKRHWERRANESGEITYLALGDSAAQGIGATSPERGYVGILDKRIQEKTGKKVKIINKSVTGATLKDYLNIQAPLIKDIQADIVTIEIGANDVATLNEEVFRNEYRKVLATLPAGSYVANMPLFNSRPGSKSKAMTATSIIEEELQQYPQLVPVDLQKQTTENQTIFGFAPDLFHPNNVSYTHWANAFWERISGSTLL